MDLCETPNRPLMLIFWYQKMIFWYEKLISDIRKSISDIRKSISDIRKSARISDIRKSFMHILISETRFSYIRNYFLISEIIFWYQKFRFFISENHFWYQNSDIRKSFSDIYLAFYRSHMNTIQLIATRWKTYVSVNYNNNNWERQINILNLNLQFATCS